MIKLGFTILLENFMELEIMSIKIEKLDNLYGKNETGCFDFTFWISFHQLGSISSITR